MLSGFTSVLQFYASEIDIYITPFTVSHYFLSFYFPLKPSATSKQYRSLFLKLHKMVQMNIIIISFFCHIKYNYYISLNIYVMKQKYFEILRGKKNVKKLGIIRRSE